jgi:hypothetical protein
VVTNALFAKWREGHFNLYPKDGFLVSSFAVRRLARRARYPHRAVRRWQTGTEKVLLLNSLLTRYILLTTSWNKRLTRLVINADRRQNRLL